MISRPLVTGSDRHQIAAGDFVTLTGSGFGEKVHDPPLKWDDFEDGESGTAISQSTEWISWPDSGVHAPSYYDGLLNRAGSTFCSENRMGPGTYDVRNSRLKWWTEEPTDRFYVSFWANVDVGRNIVDDDGSYQQKFWRLVGTNDTGDWMGNPSLGTSFWYYNESGSTGQYYWVRTDGIPFGGTDYYSPAPPRREWFRVELQMQQSDENVNNGGFNIWHSQPDGPILMVASNWDAVNMDEYDPVRTPIASANVKSWIDAPPKKYSARIVNRVVTDVFIDRAIV